MFILENPGNPYERKFHSQPIPIPKSSWPNTENKFKKNDLKFKHFANIIYLYASSCWFVTMKTTCSLVTLHPFTWLNFHSFATLVNKIQHLIADTKIDFRSYIRSNRIWFRVWICESHIYKSGVHSSPWQFTCSLENNGRWKMRLECGPEFSSIAQKNEYQFSLVASHSMDIEYLDTPACPVQLFYLGFCVLKPKDALIFRWNLVGKEFVVIHTFWWTEYRIQ